MWEMVVRSNKWLDDKSPITSVKNNKFSLFSNPVIFQIGPATAQQHYAQKGFLLYSQNIEKCRFCTCSLGSFAHLCLLSLQNDGLSQLLIYDSEECTWVQLCSLLCFCIAHMCRLHSGQLPTSVWGISSHIFLSLSSGQPLYCQCQYLGRYLEFFGLADVSEAGLLFWRAALRTTAPKYTALTFSVFISLRTLTDFTEFCLILY